MIYAWSQEIRSFGPPVAKLWSNIFQYISINFMKSSSDLVCHQLDQKQKYFRGGFAIGCLWPLNEIGCNAGVPSTKKIFQIMSFFGDLRLSIGHFGQKVPYSPVSQLQNGASTSSLPPFIVDLSTFKVSQRSISFFQCKLRVLNGQFHDQSTMGRNSSVLNGQNDVGLTQGRPGKRKDTWERT